MSYTKNWEITGARTLKYVDRAAVRQAQRLDLISLSRTINICEEM
jgi:hypothetical protein